MKKQPNAKVFMGLTVLTLVVGVALCMFQYSAVQDVQKRVATLKRDQLDEGELENKLRTSETQLRQTSATLNHLEKGVPELEYVPTMLKELESIGKESGLEVLGVRPIPKVAKNPKDTTAKDGTTRPSKPKYEELDIEVTCRGNFGSVQNFLKALQTFPKIVAVRTIALVPKSDNSPTYMGPPKLDTTIQLRSYLFPLNKSEMKQASAFSENNPQGTQPAGNAQASPNATATSATKQEAKSNVS